LPDIQAVHADTGCFSGSTGSKENWISGFFGVSGCCVMCVANFDSARIEFYLGSNDKTFNKKAFDILYGNKADIESTLGTELTWDRGEDKKSAKAYLEMKGVSINNENDWPRMRAFHVEWSKKFYDAMVPFISTVT
jgi:hypothetical protein